MKISILALTACLLTACAGPTEKPQTPKPTPQRAETPGSGPTTEAVSERVQPEIRYYEIADT